MECIFCKKTFTTKSNLVSHQKNAKYCIDIQNQNIQNQNIQNNTQEKKFHCQNCEKTFTTHQRLNEHTSNRCKLKYKTVYDDEIKKIKNEYQQQLNQEMKEKEYLNKYISKLEEKINKLETIVLETNKNTTTNNNTTNNNTTNITVMTSNVLNLSQEHIKKVLTENLDYNVVYAGQAGLAKFVVDNMLTDETGKIIYKCVDPSRQMFEFMNENGEIIRDMKAEKLIQSLISGDVIKIGLNEASKGWSTEDKNLNMERSTIFAPKVSEYADLNRNNTVFRSKVSSLTV